VLLPGHPARVRIAENGLRGYWKNQQISAQSRTHENKNGAGKVLSICAIAPASREKAVVPGSLWGRVMLNVSFTAFAAFQPVPTARVRAASA
jgi:hypothetical protein